MSILTELLDEKKVLISDGAWGTEFSRQYDIRNEALEKLNFDRPDDVLQIPASYVEAGSDIVITNTFGGSTFMLAKSGLKEKTYELNKLGVELSKKGAGGKALVFASIGPSGEFMAPLGTLTEDVMIEAFAEQVKAFVDGGADGVVIETMTALDEAKAALRAVKENSSLPVVVSMTFDKGARGYATMMGITPEKAAGEFEAAGADAVGSNCGSGIENLIEVARLMKSVTYLPLWIKPNAGLPELVNGETVFRQSPEEMASHVGELLEAGASILGGYCGTTPGHIKLMAQEVRRLLGK